jgi:cytochrome c
MPGFAYSSALAGKNGVWNYDEIWHFLNNPAKYLKGTKMSFAGIKKPEELADVIAYLRTQHDNAPALPAIKVEEPKAEEVKTEIKK